MKLVDWFIPANFKLLASRVKYGVRFMRSKATIYSHKPSRESLFVFANGPSLSKDVKRYHPSIMTSDRMFVNYSALSPLFEEFKPNYYLLLDPLFFTDDSVVDDVTKEKRRFLIETFRSKVSWVMYIIVPKRALSSMLVKLARENSCIEVLWFDDKLERPDINDVDYSGWASGRVSPPGQTVINTAVYLGIFWRYHKVCLIGADMTLHKTVSVEQSTNLLYKEDEHFYGKDSLKYVTDPSCNNIGAWLYAVAKMFIWHRRLREFADTQGVRVINASSFSYVDAYERDGLTSN